MKGYGERRATRHVINRIWGKGKTQRQEKVCTTALKEENGQKCRKKEKRQYGHNY